MNISTNTLLNVLLTKADPSVKSKIDKLSVDGKLDSSSINQITKEKSIQTLLNGFFKDISNGVKSKGDVTPILENGKNSLKFKDISADLKQILNSVKTEFKMTPELEKLTSLLKNTIVDIKNLDEKVLKTSIQNSGIFLESKVAQNSNGVAKNLELLTSLLKEKLVMINDIKQSPINNAGLNTAQKQGQSQNSQSSTQLNNFNKQLQELLQSTPLNQTNTQNKTQLSGNIKSELKLEIKNAVQNILKNIGSLHTSNTNNIKLENKLVVISQLTHEVKQLEQKFVQNNLSSEVIKNLKELIQQSKSSTFTNSFEIKKLISAIQEQSQSVKQNQPNNPSRNIIQNKSVQIPTLKIPDNLKSELKSDVQMILRKVESTQNNDVKAENKFSILKNVLIDIKQLENKFIQNNVPNDLTNNLKEMVSQVKNNFLNNGFDTLKKVILNIQEQIKAVDTPSVDEIKNEIKLIETKISTLKQPLSLEMKSTLINDLLQQNSKLVDKILTPDIKELLKNNIGNIKNVSGDLKNIILQMKEHIEGQNSSDSISKEFKANVDKVLSQIDYYQLSSYTSNSNHSFISFLQDDLQDVDIKFNNSSDDEFSCLINLSLKENGDLKILLQLDKNKSLSINIGVENNFFKNMIQEKLQGLRKQINSVGLSLSDLNIFDLKEESKESNEIKAYGNNSDLNFGVDIKV